MAYLQFTDPIWKLANFSEEKLNRWQSKEKVRDFIYVWFCFCFCFLMSEMLVSTVMNKELQKYFADQKTNVARGSYRVMQNENRNQFRSS